MKKNALKKKYKLNNGFSLIEGIISLALLALIIVPFLHMFLYSTITNDKSEKAIDATYLAQKTIEDIYEYSLKNLDFTPLDKFEKHTDSLGTVYWVEQKVEIIDDDDDDDDDIDNKLVKVIVRVYSDELRSELKTKMETYLLLLK